MSTLLQDFKKGPLDYYRNKASFDWKKLKTFLETEEVIKYQVRIQCTLTHYLLILYANHFILIRMSSMKNCRNIQTTNQTLYSAPHLMNKGTELVAKISFTNQLTYSQSAI